MHFHRGIEYLPELRAVGLLALAGVAGLLAARGPARFAVGCLLALAGLLTGLRTVGVLARGSAPHPSPTWPLLALAGSLLLLAAGSDVVRSGRRWAALPARYDRTGPPPAAAPGADPAPAWWDAIDRGEDPTGP